MEDPGYRLARWAFAALGLRVRGVAVDRDGLDVDALPKQARAVYVTPSHQYPLGVSMTLPRRLALLAWADRHNTAIIEDDYDSEFRFGGRPIEPLRMLDSDRAVIYVGSFSKTLLPTLRLGFVVAPPSLREAVHKAKFVADWHTSTTIQAVLAQFIDERRICPSYPQGARSLSHASPDDRGRTGPRFCRPSRGRPLHRRASHRRCRAHRVRRPNRRPSCAGRPTAGVVVQELSKFGVDSPGPPGLLLGYGAIPTARIEDGLRRLRSCFSH